MQKTLHQVLYYCRHINTNITLSFGRDNKIIIVHAPIEGYWVSEKYKLVVNNKMNAENGEGLQQTVTMSKQGVLTSTQQLWLTHVEMRHEEARRRWDIWCEFIR